MKTNLPPTNHASFFKTPKHFHPAKLITIGNQQHPINKGDFNEADWQVMNALTEKGHKVFVRGGKIRNSLLLPKLASRDTDLLTTATAAEIQTLFAGQCTQNSGSINSITINIKNSYYSYRIDINSLDLSLYNIAPFSALENYIDSTDFTCNAFLLSVEHWSLICKPLHMELFQKGIIQTVDADPENSFANDPSRILRGVRIADEINFRFGQKTLAAISTCKQYINNLRASRIMKHLSLMVSARGQINTINLINQYELAPYLTHSLEKNPAYFLKDFPAQPSLHEAIFANDLQRFLALLYSQPKLINARDEQGHTALDIIKLLPRAEYLSHLLVASAMPAKPPLDRKYFSIS